MVQHRSTQASHHQIPGTRVLIYKGKKSSGVWESRVSLGSFFFFRAACYNLPGIYFPGQFTKHSKTRNRIQITRKKTSTCQFICTPAPPFFGFHPPSSTITSRKKGIAQHEHHFSLHDTSVNSRVHPSSSWVVLCSRGQVSSSVTIQSPSLSSTVHAPTSEDCT